jgi:hypothetical protein
MSWFNSLGKMAKGVADFTGIAGLYHDLSTSMSNDDPWYVDSLNVAKDIGKIGTTPVRAAVKGVLAVGEKSYELGGVARQAIEKGILDTPLMYNKFKNQGESYDDYKMRVEANKEQISLGQASLSLLSPGKNSADRSGYFQDWTDNHLRFLSAGFDLFNADDRKAAFQDQYTGKFLSGMEDVVASTVIDPLTFTGFLGKGAVIASKATMLDNVNGRVARAVFGKLAMTPQKVDEIVAQGVKGEGPAARDLQYLAETDAADQAGYWAKKKVTNPDAMAFLFGRAKTVEEVGEVFSAITGKNTKAMAALAERDPQSGLVVEKFIDGPSHAERQLLNGQLEGDILVSQEHNAAIADYVTDLINTDTRYASAMEKVATGGTQLKYGFERGPMAGRSIKAGQKQAARTFGEPIIETFQKTSLHPVIKVVNYFREDLPSGVFNVNDGNSFQEFNTFLREVNDLSGRTFGPKARELADNYLTSATEAERMDVIVRAEQTALGHLFPQYSKEEIDKLYALFDSRRATAIAKHKDQGFISYFVGDTIQHAVAPILNREAANTVIIADMRKLKYAIDAHEGSLKTLLSGIDTQDLALRGQKGLAAIDTINDVFKTSVLMRLGYTVRNLTEAQLSMAAKGFALPGMALANGKEGLTRFFNNRKTGFSRLGDHVNVLLGRADDAKVLNDEVGRYVDALRNDDMTLNQMVKHINQRLGELLDSRTGFKERPGAQLTPEGMKPLVVEDEVKLLLGALSDLESKVTYHGSPGKFNLDKTRPVATSGVKSIADRYAEGGMIASIEQYIPTKTGRTGRLGQKPEITPGAEIGSAGVVERINDEAFTELNSYINGDFGDVQAGLRDPSFATSRGKKVPELPKSLQRTIQRSVLTKSLTVYRGTTNPKSPFINAQVGDIIEEPAFVSTSYNDNVARGFASPNPIDNVPTLNTNLKPGEDMLIPGQGSVSTQIEMKLPKGLNALDIAETYTQMKNLGYANLSKESMMLVNRESEVLLPAGTKFRVISRGGNAKNGYAVTVEAILPEVKIPSVKRQDILNEATLKLQSDMIDAVNAGKKVEIKKGATWQRVKAIDYETLVLALESDEFETVLFKDWTHRPVFRVGYKEGKSTQIRSYGKALHLTQKAQRDLVQANPPVSINGRMQETAYTPAGTVGSWRNLPEELKTEVFENKVSNFSSWLKTKGWQEKDDAVTRWAKDNGYGSLVVSDDARAGGRSDIIFPEYIDNEGRARQVKQYLKSIEQGNLPLMQADVAAEFEAANMTPKERRLASRASRKRARSGIRDNAVSPYYLQDGLQAMINNGIEDAAANIARSKAESLAALDDAVTRLGARIDVAETNAVKQRIGYGYQTIDAGGHTYQLPKAYQDATWFMSRASAEGTWNNQVANQEMAFLTGIGSRSVRLIQPNDPRYFEGWANILNMHFRDPETGVMDAVVRQVLDNKSDDEILKWFHTREGQRYANETYTQPGKYFGFHKVSSGEMDEKLIERLNITRGAVKAYIPDAETELMLSSAKPEGRPLSGGEVQKFLTERFASTPEKLTPLNGLLVVTSKEYKDQERIIDTINRRVMRFLGSLPEDVFARHPLAAAMYDKQLEANIKAIARVKGKEELTVNELNRAVAHARETSRQEVERTLFTIVRRSGASSSRVVKLLFPFYAAYENTLRRWGGMIAEDPTLLATAGRTIAQVVHGQTIIDQNGNRITDATKLEGGASANLVVRVPQQFIDNLPKSWRGVVQDSFKNLNIPLNSLDVITQGQPGNPGLGPFAVLPAYLVLKERPELEDALKVFFPVGMPQKASDLFLPSALRRLSTVWNKDDLYVRSYNQMLSYEMYNYRQGKRADVPTVAEITARTNKFYFLRALTSISAPFAIAPEVDFYAQTYRQFQQQYADYRDPQTGERVLGMADAKFLEMYPDFFEATISKSKNEGKLEASLGTVRNLRKFSNLMAKAQSSGDSELLGFLANDGDNQYTFSQAAYQWQYKHGATPGSGSTYRQNRTANELLIEAEVKRGWTEFQNVMGQLSAYQKQNGIQEGDPEMAIVKAIKAEFVNQMKTTNLNWYSAYISPDKAKYERRAQILEAAFKDKKWMAQNGDRAVVKQALVYLDGRKQFAAILKERDAAGGSGTLNAKSNADVAQVYQMFVDELTNGSPEFEQFINRYFANDSVVL